jgi:branched-subunit amino acid aminotransferase/4-amino-4-deoxychorismate lyase
MSVPLAWLNGRFLPRDEAQLPIHDSGLVFGAAITDFCRTFRHQLFRWTDHLARFRHDCDHCFIPLTLDDTELTAIAHQLVAHNARLIEPEQELALISFSTPGAYGFYAGTPGQEGPPTLGLHTAVLPFDRYRSFFTEGVALAYGGQHDAKRHDLVPPHVKHRNRLHWWRAERIVRNRIAALPGPERRIALVLDSSGCITDTAIGNVLVVRKGAVHSPGWVALEGISLRVVEETCEQLNIPFSKHEVLTLEDCYAASEVMLCGSAFCLAGVSWIEGRSIPWPGPITQRLLAAWSERVGVDIAGQFLSTR